MAGWGEGADEFAEWCTGLRLDSGKPFELEPFQLAFLTDLFGGFVELWLVVPEGSGKTTLLAAIALHHCLHTPTAYVPIAASSREQAEVLYRQAEGFVTRSPSIRRKFICQDGFRRILSKDRSSRIQVYAADDRTADGVIPSLALIDELHRHRNLRLYRTWRGKLDKRDGQLITISTAGEPGSEFEESRSHILATADDRTDNGPHIRAADDELVLHDWAVRNRDHCDDLEVVAAANPLSKVTVAVLAKKLASKTMTPEHFQRFTCNIATRIDATGVNPEEWDVLAEPDLDLTDAAYLIGGLDLGWKVDTTGIVMLGWVSNERRLVGDVRVIEPPVDEEDVVAAILDLDAKYSPRGWVYDPSAGGQQLVQMLEKGTHPLQVQRRHRALPTFIDHSQANSAMSLAASRLDEAIRNGWLKHDGDKALRQHALNAVRKSTGSERFKFDRPADAQGARRKLFPIDAFTALLMAHSIAVGEQVDGGDPIVIFA